MAENDEELLRKRMSQQTKQRTGLVLLFDPKCGDQQRKRNGRADIKATKRMAGSIEAQEPHIHAWTGEEKCMHGESKARRAVCSDFFVNGMFFLSFVFSFLLFFLYVYNRVLNPAV